MKSALTQERVHHHQALKTAVDRITESLSAMPEVEKVVLIGSYARGRCDLFTDLDVIVVMQSDKGLIERTGELYSRIRTGVDVDFLVYTPAEWDKMSKKPFLRNALMNGKLLYEKRTP